MTTTTIDVDRLRDRRRTAIDQGIEAALEELAALPRPPLPVGCGRRLLVPPNLLARLPEAAELGRHRTDTGELALAELPAADDPDPAWLIGTAWIRIGAIERLNRRATERLSRRRVRGGPTIGLQLVRASVGDTASALAEAAAVLECDPETALRSADLIDRRIDEALRGTWKLFGASGYVVDAPADLAYAITLLGEVYPLRTEDPR